MAHLRKLLICLIIPLLGGCSQEESKSWLIAYYMPYDNNLSIWADTVINQLREIRNPHLTITVQADLEGPGGMKQYWIKEGEVSVEPIRSDESDSGASLELFLNSLLGLESFDKIALIFLDHGGRIDEVGLDEYTDTAPSFLNLHDIRSEVSAFNRKRGKPLELLYFQVCTKSSVEVLYETREISKFTLASQNELGAPNYYYYGLNQLKSSDNGSVLADLIVDHEREDMYYSETLIDNRYWNELIKAGQEEPGGKPDPNAIKLLRYYGSSYLDLLSFYQASGYSDQQLEIFTEKLNQLILWHKINPENPKMNGYCGISVLSPWDKDYPRHTGGLELYSVWDITQLATHIR